MLFLEISTVGFLLNVLGTYFSDFIKNTPTHMLCTAVESGLFVVRSCVDTVALIEITILLNQLTFLNEAHSSPIRYIPPH